jgi:cytochrome c
MCLLSLAPFASVVVGQQKLSGKESFQARCSGCHSVDADGIGPRLRGVVGRAAGSVHTFKYSDAVKASQITWDAVALDKWLEDPDSVIPDNDMSFRLDSKTERTAIIDYLRHMATK